MCTDRYLHGVASELDQFEDVPDDVLSEVVVRGGACMQMYARGESLPWTNDPERDRNLAGRVCAGCPVRFECAEWEMRTAGSDTRGVWGLLGETDRRDLYEIWSERRDLPREIPFDMRGGEW